MTLTVTLTFRAHSANDDHVVFPYLDVFLIMLVSPARSSLS